MSRLRNLHIDILLKLFRDFIPLKEKLRLLSPMTEYCDILTYRGAYLNSPIPFSPVYLQFLNDVRIGWYFARSNWNHWCYLQIDERTLHVVLYHFFLDGFESVVHEKIVVRGDISRRFENLGVILSEFDYLEADTAFEPPPPRMYIYRSTNHGLIIVDSHSAKDGWFTMWFHDGRKFKIKIGRKQKIPMRWRLAYHFEIIWTIHQTLIVHCLFPSQTRCGCTFPVQELSPITFQASTDFEMLNWSDSGDSVSLATWQRFRLAKDEEHVETDIIYYVDEKEPYFLT